MLTAGRTSSPPVGPLLVFDGDCGFCRFWVERWRAWTDGHFRFEPFQTAAEKFPDMPRERFEKAVQLIEPNGAVYAGADAFFRLLEFVRGFGWLAILLRVCRVSCRVARRSIAGSRAIALFHPASLVSLGAMILSRRTSPSRAGFLLMDSDSSFSAPSFRSPCNCGD